MDVSNRGRTALTLLILLAVKHTQQASTKHTQQASSKIISLQQQFQRWKLLENSLMKQYQQDSVDQFQQQFQDADELSSDEDDKHQSRKKQLSNEQEPREEHDRVNRNRRQTGDITPGEQIVDGHPSFQCKWPWIAAVTVTGNDTFFRCAASLISDEWLLTAAHCFYGMPSGFQLSALFGAYNLSADDQQLTIPIDTIIIHENYNESEYGYNDLALLKLRRPITGRDSTCAQPIALPVPAESIPAANESQVDVCKILGWGKTDGGADSISEVLTEKFVDVLTNKECQDLWSKSLFTSQTIYLENICANSFDKLGLTSCQGDSGGPLQCFYPGAGDKKGWVLEGVSSWGSRACKKFPSVYMRVELFYEWIHQYIKGPQHHN